VYDPAVLAELEEWFRRQTPLGLLRLFLIDAPMFVVGVWARLYLYILAFGSLILWAVLIWWLARFVWRSLW